MFVRTKERDRARGHVRPLLFVSLMCCLGSQIRQLKEQARIRDEEMTGLREKMERAQSESSRVNQQCEDLTSRMTSKTEEINTLF